MRRVYVAGAIGANDAGRAARIQAAVDTGRILLRRNFAPIVPHYFAAAMPDADEVLGYEGYMAVCFTLLEACDAVFRIPGESPGADREVRHSIARGVPVFFSLDDLIAWRDERDAAAREDALMPLRQRLREAEAEFREICDGARVGRIVITPEELDAQSGAVENARVALRKAERKARGERVE